MNTRFESLGAPPSKIAMLFAGAITACTIGACDGPAMTAPDAGGGLVIRADPEAASYRVGAMVRLSTEGPSRWTLETEGFRRDVAVDATSIGVELSEGWTAVSACDDTACGHRGLYASLSDLAIEIENRSDFLRFRVQTASELEVFASVWAPERGEYTEEGVVVPGRWITTGARWPVERLEFAAFTRTQHVTRTLDVWPPYSVTDPRGSVVLSGGTNTECEPLLDMFTRVLVHEPWEPFVYEDLTIAVTSARVDEVSGCRRVQVSGTSSGEYRGEDATGTFDAVVVWTPSNPPNAPRLLTDFSIVDVHATHADLLFDEAIGRPVDRLWERFSHAAFETFATPIRAPSGVTVTPTFVACTGCAEVGFYLPGTYLSPYSDDYCRSTEPPPIALGPGLFNAMLVAWWSQYGTRARWTDLGVETLDLPPLIFKRIDEDDLLEPRLMLPQMAVTSRGTTHVGRIEQPLRNSPDALGWEPESEPSVWLLDGRRLTSDAGPTGDRAIYEAFAAAFNQIYAEIRSFMQLPRPDPIARWIEAFPEAELDRFALVPGPCVPSGRPCARICGEWARVP